MAGGAQAKISTWFSKPNQSLIEKVRNKDVVVVVVVIIVRNIALDNEKNYL